jgi:hypothetical protein
MKAAPTAREIDPYLRGLIPLRVIYDLFDNVIVDAFLDGQLGPRTSRLFDGTTP